MSSLDLEAPEPRKDMVDDSFVVDRKDDELEKKLIESSSREI